MDDLSIVDWSSVRNATCLGCRDPARVEGLLDPPRRPVDRHVLPLPVGQLETKNVRDCLQRDSKCAHGPEGISICIFVEQLHMFNQACLFTFTGLGGCGANVAHTVNLFRPVEHGSQE
eukprot:g2197.t1